MPKKFQWIEPSEKEIETAILDTLSLRPGCFAFKVNTTGIYDEAGGFYRKLSKYVIPGTSDIISCVDVLGLPIFVSMEVKSPKGVQSDNQKEFQRKLEERANGLYYLVRSIQDADNAIKDAKAKVQNRIQSLLLR